MKLSEKDVAYITPLICDFISMCQEDQVCTEKLLSQLRDGAILCRLLSLLFSQDFDFFDPVEDDKQANENINTFITTVTTKLHFPIVFEQGDLFAEVEESEELFYNPHYATVIETLCYLAKCCADNPNMRTQMSSELISYVNNNFTYQEPAKIEKNLPAESNDVKPQPKVQIVSPPKIKIKEKSQTKPKEAKVLFKGISEVFNFDSQSMVSKLKVFVVIFAVGYILGIMSNFSKPISIIQNDFKSLGCSILPNDRNADILLRHNLNSSEAHILKCSPHSIESFSRTEFLIIFKEPRVPRK